MDAHATRGPKLTLLPDAPPRVSHDPLDLLLFAASTNTDALLIRPKNNSDSWSRAGPNIASNLGWLPQVPSQQSGQGKGIRTTPTRELIAAGRCGMISTPSRDKRQSTMLTTFISSQQ